jgi:hypothetical protein
VIAKIYPDDREAQFGYFELNYTINKPLAHLFK